MDALPCAALQPSPVGRGVHAHRVAVSQLPRTRLQKARVPGRFMAAASAEQSKGATASTLAHARALLERQGRHAEGSHEPSGGSSAGQVAAALALSGMAYMAAADVALARPEGVNKPELLPPGFTRVIDVAGFLSQGQEQRIASQLENLESDTGFKLRVLAQNYPRTPGLAIRDYWGVDDETVVFVADPTMGNILNFNVGASVDLRVPRSFWTRLAGKYGNIFYWREQGEDVAIETAVAAIDACLREEPGPRQCADIQ